MRNWLIHGFFCESGQLHVTRIHSDDDESVKVNARSCKGMFFGIIGPDEGCSDRLIGRMMDGYGMSFLVDITMSDARITFGKKYDNVGDVIRYEFFLVDGVWVGTYNSRTTGRGGATCTLTEASRTLLVPPVFQSL